MRMMVLLLKLLVSVLLIDGWTWERSQLVKVMVYQEDVMKVAVAMGGFSVYDGDQLRKVLSKKHKARQLQDYQNCLKYLEQLEPISPYPENIRQQIKDVKSKLAAKD